MGSRTETLTLTYNAAEPIALSAKVRRSARYANIFACNALAVVVADTPTAGADEESAHRDAVHRRATWRRKIAGISVSGVSHRYEGSGANGRTEALRDVSIEVAQSEFVSLIGPSGCGKTTLLRAIGGLLRPSEGCVQFDGAPPAELQRQGRIGFVFQDAALLPWRTALGNVCLPLQLNRLPGAYADDVAERALESVGLAQFAAYYPHQLSGGMRQRVALARALALQPDVLLMDEPFGALDEMTRQDMRYELVRLWERRRTTVLFVTHSIAEAVLLSNRVLVLSDHPGEVVADIAIELERPRHEAIERTPRFLEYTYRIRDALSLGRNKP